MHDDGIVSSVIKNFRNTVDFNLRKLFSWNNPIEDSSNVHEKALIFQSEVRQFLDLFEHIRDLPREVVAADIGARTFSMAPVFDKYFFDAGVSCELHGIEIDAYRRFTDFHTRADYGAFYAMKVTNGFYHPVDFLRWNQDLDFAFLLNPFVTLDPLLNWGLPQKHFKPKKIFDHTADLLSKRAGKLLLSCPNEEELQISERLAYEAGLKKIEKQCWYPGEFHQQKQPRLGLLFRGSVLGL